MAKKENIRKFNITGMSCAACSAHVEKAVKAVPGVEVCEVNLLMNQMTVGGSADTASVISAVENAGYGASLNEGNSYDGKLTDSETPVLKKRLFTSLIILLPLMYVSMGHHMFSWPVPSVLHNPVANAVYQLILTTVILVINRKFFINGIIGAAHGAPNMDTLVSLGAGASYIYSLFVMIHGVSANELYFESAAMILTLITVGKTLEAYSKGKTTNAIKSLMDLSPKTARIIDKDGNEKIIQISEIRIGDVFSVLPGESIPADGIIIDGMTSVNESALTGESIPADKVKGDEIFAATINITGHILCQTTKAAEDSTISRIIKMVSDASSTKAPIARIADKVSGVFVPAVLGIALVTFIIWMLNGEELRFALSMGISVLVISCPCALGLATPVAIMVGNGIAAKHGILFKTSVALENAGKVQCVAVDKTGTVTLGIPKVTDVQIDELRAAKVAKVLPAKADTDEAYSLNNQSGKETASQNEERLFASYNEYLSFHSEIADNGESYLSYRLLVLAASVEQYSEHPLALAINDYASEKGIKPLEVTDFMAEIGVGVSCKIGEDVIRARAADTHTDNNTYGLAARKLAQEGKTPLAFYKNDELLGVIAVADEIKKDSFDAVKELCDMGLKVTMITGDNEPTAKAIGMKAGITNIIAGIKPDEKAKTIEKIKERGLTAMVGDGINDAPALTTADIGIAIGAGTDVAIDSADIVLMKNSLMDVRNAITISRETLRCIKQNLFWAFFYNCIGIPVAAGALYTSFGIKLSPMIGAFAMSLSSFCVVTNALRLNLKIPKLLKKTAVTDIENSIDTNQTIKNQEDIMEYNKLMNVEGMMCSHCEASVKKALEALCGVSKAEASHTDGTVKVWFEDGKTVADEDLKAAVEAKDYAVTGMQ